MQPKNCNPLVAQRTFEKSARAVLKEVRQIHPDARLASGAPADCGRVSDIDIFIPAPDGTAERRESYVRFGREVNLLSSSDPSRRRALTHRLVELRLLRSNPAAAEAAAGLKAKGIKTEPAWAQVLGLVGDPYAAVAALV